MYSKEFREKVCNEYLNSGITRKDLAEKYNIPFETFKGWMKRYYANGHNINGTTKQYGNMIESSDYNKMTQDELKLELIKKDIEIERLKKNYAVKVNPTTGEKEYIIYNDKTTK